MQNSRRIVNVVNMGALMLLLFVAGLAFNRLTIKSMFADGAGGPSPVDEFTYQGYLENDGSPIDGDCDFRFYLYDSLSGGMSGGGDPLSNQATLPVDRGVFSMRLNFGNVFATHRHWLEIHVRCPSGSGNFTILSPRTEITGAPLANAMPNVKVTMPSPGVSNEYAPSTLQVTDMTASSLAVGDGQVYMFGWEDGGVIDVTNDGSLITQIRASSDGAGQVGTYGPNGKQNVFMQGDPNAPNHGFLGVYDASGNRRASMEVLFSGEGYVGTLGENGNGNTIMSSFGSFLPNNGRIAVMDSGGLSQASMYVNGSGQGVVSADIKNFRVTNPADSRTEIWYASLEGPEAGAYVRGTATLEDGKATITLPKHFVTVAIEEGLTVQLTPLSAKSLGLAVVEKSLQGIEVRELQQGTGTYEFDFLVTAVRNGYEDYEVIRPSVENQLALDSKGTVDGAVDNGDGQNRIEDN